MRQILAVATAGASLAACSQQAATVTQAQMPQVRVAQVGAQPGRDSVAATGTIALRRETSLGFTSAGRVASVRVEDGDLVAPGQMLAALDTTTVAADVASALAERERAAAEYDRSTKLLAKGWVTRPRVESARATLAAASARVRATGFQSSNAVIVAPGAGRILSRLAEPGQVVAAGAPVLVLGEMASGYVLRVPLTDRDIARIRVGAPARVDLGEGTTVAGTVTEIGGRADRATGTFAVEIALPPSDALRSGQIGVAKIVANAPGSDILSVPATAVFAPRAGEGFVYVVDRASRRVALRKVTLGEAGDGALSVTGGVKRGEWVATSRVDRLAAGMKIAPIGTTR
jgi:RND family efflux transporter MFP subunit